MLSSSSEVPYLWTCSLLPFRYHEVRTLLPPTCQSGMPSPESQVQQHRSMTVFPYTTRLYDALALTRFNSTTTTTFSSTCKHSSSPDMLSLSPSGCNSTRRTNFSYALERYLNETRCDGPYFPGGIVSPRNVALLQDMDEHMTRFAGTMEVLMQ